jgi:very-short-patch-repair endonuclease
VLKVAYDHLVGLLNKQYPDCSLRTHAEKAVLETITRSTGLQFQRALWIVNRNIDMVCTSIGQLHQYCQKGQKIDRTSVMRGLAIEVDGKVHDRETKMKKDNSKLDMLRELGIGCASIENADIHAPIVQNLIRSLKNMPRLPYRSQLRLKRKIYIATLAYHASDEVMASLYGPRLLTLTAGDHTLKGNL